jgi:hypothetical protein
MIEGRASVGSSRMVFYFAALVGYCLGYAAYAGTAALGLPQILATVLGGLVGITPLFLVIRDYVQRRRERVAARAAAAAAAAAVPPPPAWSPNLDFAELQQRPIPCRCCGAPMVPGARFGSIELVQCPYCRRTEEVPYEAAQRIEFLRSRAAELRAARQALTDLDRRTAEVLEDGRWLRGTLLAALGPTALIVGLVVLPGFYVGGAFGMMIGMKLLAQLGGTVLGMVLSYRAVAHRYLRVIRPRILARAPERPGAPARCRVCGGPVEVRGSAFVACSFCGSTNLVTRELVRECRRFLDAEIAEYRYRASSANRTVEEHHQLMRRGLVLGNVLGSIAVPYALSALVSLLLR